MSWEKKALGKVADFDLGKMLDQKKNKGDSLPYLANKNVRWGSFDFTEIREMPFEQKELERFSLKSGDIVMCEGGEPGRCAIWQDQMPNMMYQKALHRIRPKQGMDSVFLYYNLSHRARTGHFNGLFTGSTIKHLPKEKLSLVEVDVPDLPLQKRIAATLSTYDDLIENNQRRIALLEDAARQLYKEWFVRFRFPGHEHSRIIDGTPEGWERKRIGDVCAKIGSGATPKGGASSYGSEGISLIRSMNVYDYQFKDDDIAFIDEGQAQRLDNVIVEESDVLLNITGASVARCCIAPKRHLPARVNQHVMILRPIKGLISPEFLMCSINHQETKQLILNIAGSGGATREALTKSDVSNLKILTPGLELMQSFQSVSHDCFQQIENLQQQNLALAQARDLLLPKLMNGEITV